MPRKVKIVDNNLWIISAEQCEQALAQHNQAITQNYDAKAHPLPDIPIGSTVAIDKQFKIKHSRWSKTGTVVEILAHCHRLLHMHVVTHKCLYTRLNHYRHAKKTCLV